MEKSKEEVPLSIDMPSHENEKRSTKELIDKSLAVSSKIVVRNRKKTISKMSERFVLFIIIVWRI